MENQKKIGGGYRGGSVPHRAIQLVEKERELKYIGNKSYSNISRYWRKIVRYLVNAQQLIYI